MNFYTKGLICILDNFPTKSEAILEYIQDYNDVFYLLLDNDETIANIQEAWVKGLPDEYKSWSKNLPFCLGKSDVGILLDHLDIKWEYA